MAKKNNTKTTTDTDILEATLEEGGLTKAGGRKTRSAQQKQKEKEAKSSDEAKTVATTEESVASIPEGMVLETPERQKPHRSTPRSRYTEFQTV